MTEVFTPGLCSVVCTTYNHASYCEASIQSILDQNYRNIEIVIVDDGSLDDNVAIMRRKLQNSYFPSHVIEQKNTGNIGLNVNRALALASGEYVCILSLDDLLLPDCIASKIALLEQDEKMMLVANTSNVQIDEAGRTISTCFKTPLHGMNYSTASQMLSHEFEHIGTFFVQGAVFRRKILSLVGGYDIDLTGDDLIIRTKIWLHMIEDPELTFALLPEPGFAYRKHPQNLHRNRFRQVRTVIDWRNRYFPKQPLPEIARRWAESYFSQCLAKHDYLALQEALNYDPEMQAIYSAYRETWRFYRRAIKHYVIKLFR